MAVTRTSSTKGTLYFAFGSNLSTSQMSVRCPSSANPLAIARLNSYSWFICNRGYANIVAVPPWEPIRDQDASTVWGLIYLLTKEDEVSLDGYEGWDNKSRGPPNPDIKRRNWKPYDQGSCSYNKFYLTIRVQKWLIDDPVAVIGSDGDLNTIRTLIYVDEVNTTPGRIKNEYIDRMSRAMLESTALGIPQRWCDNVMKQHGIEAARGMNVKHYAEASRQYMDESDREEWEAIREKLLLNDIHQSSTT